MDKTFKAKNGKIRIHDDGLEITFKAIMNKQVFKLCYEDISGLHINAASIFKKGSLVIEKKEEGFKDSFTLEFGYTDDEIFTKIEKKIREKMPEIIIKEDPPKKNIEDYNFFEKDINLIGVAGKNKEEDEADVLRQDLIRLLEEGDSCKIRYDVMSGKIEVCNNEYEVIGAIPAKYGDQICEYGRDYSTYYLKAKVKELKYEHDRMNVVICIDKPEI